MVIIEALPRLFVAETYFLQLCTNSTGMPGVLLDFQTMYRVPGDFLDYLQF